MTPARAPNSVFRTPGKPRGPPGLQRSPRNRLGVKTYQIHCAIRASGATDHSSWEKERERERERERWEKWTEYCKWQRKWAASNPRRPEQHSLSQKENVPELIQFKLFGIIYVCIYIYIYHCPWHHVINRASWACRLFRILSVGKSWG